MELSEFIALRHEERPTWTKWMHDILSWQASDGGWWFGYRDDPSDDVEPIEKHARSILEPEIAMRLLRELLVDWIVSIDWSSQLKNYEVALDSKSSNESHVGVGGSLELAIAQAWKKAVESK